MECGGALKQGNQRLKASNRVHRAALQRAMQGRGQKTQPLDVAANAQQAPAVVAGHAVGLRAGDGRHVLAAMLEGLQGGLGRVITTGRLCGAAPGEFFFGAHHHAPMFLRQTLPHCRASHLQGAQVVADTGCPGTAAQAVDERALKHAAGLRGRRHARQNQGVDHRHATQPGSQRRRRLLFAMEALQGQAGQADQVLGALGVAAKPVQVFGGAAGDRAFALGQQRRCAQRRLRCAIRRVMGQRPDISAAAAKLHGGDVSRSPGQPRHAAG